MSLALSRGEKRRGEENGLPERGRGGGKKGKKGGEGGIEIEGRPQERRRRPLLVYVSESSGCLNGDTFTRAASYGGKADLSAPTIPFPPLPSVHGSPHSPLPLGLPLPFLRHLSSPRRICYPPLALGRVPPAFQPVYKEDRVLHGDISLSRVPREVEEEESREQQRVDEGRRGRASPKWTGNLVANRGDVRWWIRRLNLKNDRKNFRGLIMYSY